MPQQPFAMPMYRDFVPHCIRPWIYLVVAFTFQMSGGLYLAALDELEGARDFMREDCLMALYMTMAGLALYFPILFPAKFRFMNKTLLIYAALLVICGNLITLTCDFLPLVWLGAFLAGMGKLQGTFECMSNIQLWMSPQRDFRVFFPILHILILGSVCVNFMLGAICVHWFTWQEMHWIIIGLMLLDLLFFWTCLRFVRHMPKQPFTQTDIPGALLWAAVVLQTVYLFCYGDYYNWTDSHVVQTLMFTIPITLAMALHRMWALQKPYLEPAMWKYKNLFPLLLLSLAYEGILAAEHVLEEVYCSEVMHYDVLTHHFNRGAVGLLGVLGGCGFALLWLKLWHRRVTTLFFWGTGALIFYLAWIYMVLTPELNVEKLYPAVVARNFASATLSISLLVSMQASVGFFHFFQSLAIFQSIHLFLGSAAGAALYGEGLRRYIGDGFARFGRQITSTSPQVAEAFGGQGGGDMGTYIGTDFLEQVMAAALKQLYGWAVYAAVGLLLLFMLYDGVFRKSHFLFNLLMPRWASVARILRKGAKAETVAAG